MKCLQVERLACNSKLMGVTVRTTATTAACQAKKLPCKLSQAHGPPALTSGFRGSRDAEYMSHGHRPTSRPGCQGSGLSYSPSQGQERPPPGYTHLVEGRAEMPCLEGSMAQQERPGARRTQRTPEMGSIDFPQGQGGRPQGGKFPPGASRWGRASLSMMPSIRQRSPQTLFSG